MYRKYKNVLTKGNIEVQRCPSHDSTHHYDFVMYVYNSVKQYLIYLNICLFLCTFHYLKGEYFCEG